MSGTPDPALLVPIGAGSTRDCFAHPRDPALCIKVPRTPQGSKMCAREARYLDRVRRRFPAADMARLPRYRGRVTTDHGPGWLQDRVLDASGEPSPTLARALDRSGYADAPARWDAAFADFVGWLLAQPFELRDLTPTNLCVQGLAEGGLRLVPIDGLSPRATLPRLLPGHRVAGIRNARARSGATASPTWARCSTRSTGPPPRPTPRSSSRGRRACSEAIGSRGPVRRPVGRN